MPIWFRSWVKIYKKKLPKIAQTLLSVINTHIYTDYREDLTIRIKILRRGLKENVQWQDTTRILYSAKNNKMTCIFLSRWIIVRSNYDLSLVLWSLYNRKPFCLMAIKTGKQNRYFFYYHHIFANICPFL